MTKFLLSATRATLGAAIAVSDFIIRHADKITAAAKFIHLWALKLAEQLEQKKVEKADKVYRAQAQAAAAAWVAADRAYGNVVLLADKRDLIHRAIQAERELVAA